MTNRGHDSIAHYAVDPSKGTLALVGHIPAGGRTPRNITIDPTNQYLISANQNGENIVVFRLDPKTGNLVPTGSTGQVSQPGGVFFAGSSSIRLWDLSANGEAGVLTGHGDSKATALTFSPDGRRLVSAGGTQGPPPFRQPTPGGGTIKLWDMVTRQELYAFAHADVVRSLAFTPDGGRLVAAGQRLVMWDARPMTEELQAEREALGLLDWLYSRPLPRQEVLHRLRSHPAISERVRERARQR